MQANLPVVKNALKVYSELAVTYAVEAGNVATLYANKATQYVGTQLLGWKEGQLEQIFLDAFILANDSVYVGINWVTKSKNNLNFGSNQYFQSSFKVQLEFI